MLKKTGAGANRSRVGMVFQNIRSGAFCVAVYKVLE